MKASVQERQDAQSYLAIVAPGVLYGKCGIPFQFLCQGKRQAALGNVLLILGRVEGDTQLLLLQHQISRVKHNSL
jgi:hypothetical protein